MNFQHFYKLLLLFFVITTTAVGQNTLPIASFQISTNGGCAPLSVSISNNSINATQYEWDFGNGNSSTIAQPSVIYSIKGVYDISLIARNVLGKVDTLIIKNAITVNDIPTANFSYSVNSNCLNQNSIRFNNLSTSGINYTWDFGDGNNSTLYNPTYSYADSGNYIVKLMVSDSLGCSNFKQANQAIKIVKTPKINFTVSDTVGCDTSQLFSFNCSTNSITNWFWSFGDGDTSLIQNPTHKYNNVGAYTVTLITMSQSGCSDTLIKSNYINIFNPSNLDFSSSVTNGCAPLSVRLFGDTANKGSIYEWNIGDGRILLGDSISASFDSTGFYSIKLIQTSLNGCQDSITKGNYIQVNGGSKASFTIDSLSLCVNGAIAFTNTSTNLNSATFIWDFGDGTTSTIKNPFHTFNQIGNYSIKLTTTDSNTCSSTFIKSIQIKSLKADFTSIETSGCLPLSINFQNISSTANSWLWSFGDGDTSHQQHPSHIYTSSGKFDVSLIIKTNSGCADTINYNEYIVVFDDTLKGSLSDTILGCLPLPIDFSDNKLGTNNWIWDFGNGDSSNIMNPTYTYNTPGTYTITLKTFTSTGCPLYVENYATIKIDSIDIKVSTLNFDCQQSIIELTDSTENVKSWLWNFGDGTYSTLQSPIHQFPDTIIYDISITIETNNGCIQSLYFPSYIDFTNCLVAGIPVKPAKGAGFPNRADTINSNNILTQKCAPQIVQFSNLDTAAFSWNWNFGDGATSSLEHPRHTYNTPGLYNVSLIKENTLGKDTTVWNNYISVNGPISNFTSSIAYNCDSASVTFNNISQKLNTWKWSFQNYSDTTNLSPTLTFPYSNEYHTIQLKVRDSMGCQSTKFSILNFSEKEIIFNFPDSACVGDSILFTASDSLSTYSWSFGDGSADSSHTAMNIYSQPGIYPIQVFSKNAMGCVNSHTLDSIRIKGGTAQFQIIDTINCKNQFFYFTPNVSNADSYQWNFGNALTSTTKFPSVKLTTAGNYNISLTVSKDGCQNSFTHPTQVEVQEIEADFNIEQLNNCYPIQISVIDTNANSAEWEWKVNSISSSNLNHYSFNTQDSSINISLKVTAQNGCTDSINKVFNPSTLSSNFEISDTIVCAPFTVSFINKSVHSIHSYWSFGDGDTSTAFHPTHTYTKSGVYSVQLITNSIDGCFDTTTYQNAISVSSIAANYSTSYNSTCAPLMVHFSDSSNNATSWKWNFGDGTSSTTKNPLKIYNQPGEFDVSLIVTNSNGCKDTMVVKKQILVPGPIANFSVSDTIVCGINPIQFTDSSINAIQWNWFFGDGNTSNLQHPTHTYTTPGNYSITLTTLDSLGCNGVYTWPNTIKMSQNPSANFSVLDTTVCAPSAVALIADSSNANKWKWDLGNGIIKTDSSLNYTFKDKGAYSISLTVENEAGCIDSTRFDSLIVFGTPNAKITPVAPLCNNEKPIFLKSQEVGGIWYGNGISDPTAGMYDPKKVYSGIDTVIYSFKGSCPSSDTTYIRIKEVPKFDFNATQEEGCKELDIKFESYFTEEFTSKSKISYNWKNNGKCFGVFENAVATFKPGLFDISLEVKTSNGCSAEIKKPNFIKVYDSIPFTSIIDRVSVLSDNEVVIEWQKNTDIAFSQHVLYRKSSLDTTFQVIKTFNDQNIIKYTDQNLNTLDLIYCYKIVSVDKCGQKIEFNKVPFHCTINVTVNKIDLNTVNVTWTKYIGNSVSNYEVLRFDKTLNQTSVIAKVSSTEQSFIDTSAYCNYDYSYRIQATGPGGLIKGSLSDTSEIRMEGISKFQTTEIIRATVEDNSFVLIEWSPVKVAPEFATGYVLHRSLDNQNFSPLTFVPIVDTSYNDRSTSVDIESYFYQIEVINTCVNKNQLTNTGSSILLESTQIDDHSGKLRWTKYENWEDGIKGYEIQRLNKFNQWETIKIVPENDRESIINF